MTSAELLELAAEALEDGRDPLANPFLSDNGVTLDQCYSLAEQLAIGARIMAAGIRKPKSPQGTAMLLTIAIQVAS
jgi:hypothetical protein